MHWTLTRITTFLIAILLLNPIGACQRGNKRTFDPRDKTLEEMLPKYVGESKPPYIERFRLDTVDKEASQIKNETGAGEAVRAIYVMKLRSPAIGSLPSSEETVELHHAIARFDTADAAVTSLQRAARERRLRLDSKIKNNVEVGKLFRDHEGSYIAWTNGSLLSLVATRNATLATDFEDGCPY